MPTGNYDVNGDGYDDLLTAGKGDRIDVWLGGAAGISDELGGRQTLPASGRLRGGDWNGDGLADLVLYDPRMPRRAALDRDQPRLAAGHAAARGRRRRGARSPT